MFVLAQWSGHLEGIQVAKFATQAQAESYAETLPNEFTAHVWDAKAPFDGFRLSHKDLVTIYNTVAIPPKPVKEFHDRATAITRVAMVLLDRAKEVAFTTPVEAPIESKPVVTKSGKPGVISEIVAILKNGGGTVNEIFYKLQTKYPDRGDGMLTTVKIQVNRLHKNGVLTVATEVIEGRGKVYKAA